MFDLRLFGSFLTDYWEWIKKYSEPQEPDEWWLEMMADGNKIATDELRSKIVMVTMEDIERRYHENRKARPGTGGKS